MRAATRVRIGTGAVGVGVLGYGAWGLFTEPAIHQIEPVGQWLLAGIVIHDFILAPVVFILCAVAYRVTTPRIRRALAAILLIGGSAFLVGLPDYLRKGRNGNPTVMPLNYRADLILVIGTVIGATVLFTAAGSLRARRAVQHAHVVSAAAIPTLTPTSALSSPVPLPAPHKQAPPSAPPPPPEEPALSDPSPLPEFPPYPDPSPSPDPPSPPDQSPSPEALSSPEPPTSPEAPTSPEPLRTEETHADPPCDGDGRA